MENANIIYWPFVTKLSELNKKYIKGKWLDPVPDQHLTYDIWSEEEQSLSKKNAILLQDMNFYTFSSSTDFVQRGSRFIFLPKSINDL
jgi:hypothetical protein